MAFTKHDIHPADIPTGAIHISPDDSGPLALIMKTENHEIFADEPKRLGGNDTAPNPYDFLHAGLGSCTAITLRFYAKKHKMVLEDFHVNVSSRRDTEGQLIIDKELIFHDSYNQEDLDYLVSASKKCPMHKDLLRSMEINTTVKHILH